MHRERDPEAFRLTATPGHDYRFVLRERGPFEGVRARVTVDGITVDTGVLRQAATFQAGIGDRVILSIAEAVGDPPRMAGEALIPGVVAWCRPGAEVISAYPGNVRWWNLILPRKSFEEGWAALHEGEAPHPAATVRMLPATTGQRRLLLSAARAVLAAEDTDAAHAPAADLLDLALGLAPPTADTLAGEAGATRGGEVAAALAAIAERDGSPPSLTQVCGELGVSLRSLNRYANTILGMGAAQYIRRRRLLRAQAELSAGRAARVTEAATRLGFWEFGRFAADYAALFGERPSATLRRVRGETGRQSAADEG